MDLGTNIKSSRLLKGLTQAELSDLTGMKTSHISRLESGGNTDIKISTLMKICDALGTTPNNLLMEYKDMGTDTLLKALVFESVGMPESDKKLLIEMLKHIKNSNTIKNLVVMEAEGNMNPEEVKVLEEKNIA